MPARTQSFDESDFARARRKGLRIALAVSVGFTWSVASGAIIPFLGPLFAAQFLIASSRPLSLAQTAATIGFVVVAGVVLQGVAATTADEPMVLLPLLGLFYFACFHAQATGRGGAAVFLLLVVGIMVPLLTVLHRDLGTSALAVLTYGIASGVVLTWLAHAVVPDIGSNDPPPAPLPIHSRPLLRAAADAVILLLIVTLCLTKDEWATAMVIPITVASIQTQLDLSAGARAAVGLVLINLIGGIAASAAFVLLEIRPSLLSMFVLVLLAGLVFGGRAASLSASAKVYAGALTTFLLVFGAGVSPLPGTAAESFSTRIGYIVIAVSYAMLMGALLWPKLGATLPSLPVSKAR
ncbi:DUF2955 domain-containing protein [Aurantimonas endophytica]|uniref:DUF2955 domain-containing protein n=1 Tax=Aurantimonas endophytica TaxID=1522175 RepID=UPI001606B263|nr:DUF2955 domain-containing protein [Aurantimonas endophytica]MCO6402209.1 DUF2955 domain-containing protein [Aurantimonas endophytica]